jgi:hypothetical protein
MNGWIPALDAQKLLPHEGRRSMKPRILSLRAWLQKQEQNAARRPSFRPQVEGLEERILMASGGGAPALAALNCGCTCPTELVGGNPSILPAATPSAYSAAPVRYFDGTLKLNWTDLSSDGFGTPWGVDRSWSNTPGYANTNLVGKGMIVEQLPFLVQASPGSNSTIIAITNGTTARYFDLSGGVYTQRFFGQETLTTATGEFILTDTSGNQIHYYDFTNGSLSGLFKSFVDPFGNATTTTYSGSQLTEVLRSQTVGG